ncbi:MAG: hypothetical protein R8F63_14695 [Acidimicrobiales bacterium]|nr:hypothetical protein [Acidimicrobiales bacterium]
MTPSTDGALRWDAELHAAYARRVSGPVRDRVNTAIDREIDRLAQVDDGGSEPEVVALTLGPGPGFVRLRSTPGNDADISLGHPAAEGAEIAAVLGRASQVVFVPVADALPALVARLDGPSPSADEIDRRWDRLVAAAATRLHELAAADAEITAHRRAVDRTRADEATELDEIEARLAVVEAALPAGEPPARVARRPYQLGERLAAVEARRADDSGPREAADLVDLWEAAFAAAGVSTAARDARLAVPQDAMRKRYPSHAVRVARALYATRRRPLAIIGAVRPFVGGLLRRRRDHLAPPAVPSVPLAVIGATALASGPDVGRLTPHEDPAVAPVVVVVGATRADDAPAVVRVLRSLRAAGTRVVAAPEATDLAADLVDLAVTDDPVAADRWAHAGVAVRHTPTITPDDAYAFWQPPAVDRLVVPIVAVDTDDAWWADFTEAVESGAVIAARPEVAAALGVIAEPLTSVFDGSTPVLSSSLCGGSVNRARIHAVAAAMGTTPRALGSSIDAVDEFAAAGPARTAAVAEVVGAATATTAVIAIGDGGLPDDAERFADAMTTASAGWVLLRPAELYCADGAADAIEAVRVRVGADVVAAGPALVHVTELGVDLELDGRADDAFLQRSGPTTLLLPTDVARRLRLRPGPDVIARAFAASVRAGLVVYSTVLPEIATELGPIDDTNERAYAEAFENLDRIVES